LPRRRCCAQTKKILQLLRLRQIGNAVFVRVRGAGGAAALPFGSRVAGMRRL
jgi:hypothetical protein